MERLIDAARTAREDAYAPYSSYRVGAAVAAGGSTYRGCNVENANYSNSLHAEEVAVGKAVSDGHRRVERLAVTAGPERRATPCGACRQTLIEFGDAATVVVCDGPDGAEEHALGDLLPEAFTGDALRG